MSVVAGLTAGVSALTAQSRNFAIISDNIANVNTVGYKEVEARFTNFVTSRDISRNYSPGGVQIRPFVDPNQQGQIQSAEGDNNVAITGNGFFVGNTSSTTNNDNFVFTRAGAFEPDLDGNLVNTAGYFLQGWLLDDNGARVNEATADQLTSLQTVNVAGFSSIADESENVSIVANLQANSTPIAAATLPSAGGAATPTHTTNITVFDSLGGAQTLGMRWFNSDAANNQWQLQLGLVDSTGTFQDISANTGGGAASTVTVDFNPDGTLAATPFTTAAGGIAVNADNTLQFTINPADLSSGVAGAQLPNSLVLTLDLGSAGQANGLSQFSTDYELRLANQDGSPPAGLESTTIDDEGLVTAIFTNGETRPIYRVPVATFPAPTELGRADGNAFTVSADSGDVVLNIAGTGAAGFLEPQALEASTSDIAEEFSDLIIAQRAYSAATRIITTGDEMLSEAINMKR